MTSQNEKLSLRIARSRRPEGKVLCNGDGAFTIVGATVDKLLRMDEYSAANGFVTGEIQVEGDLCAAIRFFSHRPPPLLQGAWHSLAVGLLQLARTLLDGRNGTARHIRFHYDRSNAFYRQFLDSRMLYSAAQFNRPGCSLEEAQLEKLEQICRKLDLHSGDRLLDVGCGWGGLIIHAAEQYGAIATGCTLSRDQFEFARCAVRDLGLVGRVTIEEVDYRSLQGRFHKIASVGMFEHVGRRHLSEYFRKIYSLLQDGGLFLNRGIVRPENVSVGPATLFLERKVFPGGGLVHLADVVREAERVGFEVVEMEDLRRDYALTCHAWVRRLLANADECTRLVDDATYRTWLLYLAASAVSFEDGATNAVQVVFEKPRHAVPPAQSPSGVCNNLRFN